MKKKLFTISFLIVAIAGSLSAIFIKSLPEEIGILFDTPLVTTLTIILLCLEITFRYPEAKRIPPIVHTDNFRARFTSLTLFWRGGFGV